MSNSTSSRFGCFGVFIGIILCLSLLFNAGFLAGHLFDLFPQESKFPEYVIEKAGKNVSTKVAVIRLSGLISGYVPGDVGPSMIDDLKIQFKQALEDDNVKAIVLSIDSPGGEVTASDIIYSVVSKARTLREGETPTDDADPKRPRKPVVVSMGSLAASGGYYVAIAGNYIFAHETTFTGSIGVIMQTYNYEGLMDKVGVHAVTYKSGAFKDMLSGARTATPEETKYINDMVMETYGRFVGLVAKERKLPEDKLRNGIADGRVLSGKKALDEKLVDALGNFEDAVKKAKELAKISPTSGVIGYQAAPGLSKLLRMQGASSADKKIEVNLTPSTATPLRPGYFYLLPANFVQ